MTKQWEVWAEEALIGPLNCGCLKPESVGNICIYCEKAKKAFRAGLEKMLRRGDGELTKQEKKALEQAPNDAAADRVLLGDDEVDK